MSDHKFHEFTRQYNPHPNKVWFPIVFVMIILVLCMYSVGFGAVTLTKQSSGVLKDLQIDPLVLLCFICLASLGLIAFLGIWYRRSITSIYENKTEKIADRIKNAEYNHKFKVSKKEFRDERFYRSINMNRRNDDAVQYFIYDGDQKYFVDRFMYYAISEGDEVEVNSDKYDQGDDYQYVYKLKLFKDKIEEVSQSSQRTEEASIRFNYQMKILLQIMIIFAIVGAVCIVLTIGEAALFKTDNLFQLWNP